MMLTPSKILAGLVALVVLLAAAAGAGAVVNGWRLEAGHQQALAEKVARINELETAVQDQNHATELLEAKTKAADERRQAAESRAASTLNKLTNLADVVANSRATSCDGVLQESWGAR